MKRLFLAILVLLVSAAAALWFREQAGYVVITAGHYTIETSLFLLVGAIIACFIALYALVGVVRRVWGAPRGVKRWWTGRRSGKVRDRMVRGLIRLNEGEFAEAERLLLQDVERSDAPLLNYLGAALAAHRRADNAERDRYLALADKADPTAALSVGLLQAQLQIEDRQWEMAFATLNYLHGRYPKHPRILLLLSRTCAALGEWRRMLEILPALRKQNAITDDEADGLEQRAAVGILGQSTREGSQKLQSAWDSLPKRLRKNADVMLAYIDALLENPETHAGAETQIRNQLKQEWDARLVDRYGRIEGAPAEAAFAQAEAWLKDRPEDPTLLIAAGRLALASRVWGRARSYLEAGTARGGEPEALFLLAGLLDRLGEPEEAGQYYRRAAQAAGELTAPKILEEVHPNSPAKAEG